MSESRIWLSFVLGAHNWKDLNGPKLARALTGLSNFFAIPKVRFLGPNSNQEEVEANYLKLILFLFSTGILDFEQHFEEGHY